MEKTDPDSELIDRYYDGKYSEADESIICQLFCDNGKEDELKAHLYGQFNELFTEDDEDKKDLDGILYSIHYDINNKLYQQKKWPFGNLGKVSLRIACAAILLLLIYTEIRTYKYARLKRDTWIEIKAPAWSRTKFSLPDGTTGWLNSNSSLRYCGKFIDDRQVILNGEAFFEVFKNNRKPFVVSTTDISIKVLGTKFNIASYQNENSVEVVLEEGELMLNNIALNKFFLMKPNDLVKFNKTSKDFLVETVQPVRYSSWTEGKLIFRNDPLDVIARRLERWYNIDVEVRISSPENFRWHATFVDEGLEDVLKIMKSSLHVNYKLENGSLKSDGTFTRGRVVITN